ncbi:MAG: Xaa-Pro peptidase family protein [Anaerolineaceae bacterium]|nr:Xaa-Pro peptidase family protein [Anaerolineaceae bacterium]
MLEHSLEEYQNRLKKLTSQLRTQGLDAILLTSEPNMRYFTGMRSIVWDSRASNPGACLFNAEGDCILISAASNLKTVAHTSWVGLDQMQGFYRSSAAGEPSSYADGILLAFKKLKLKHGKVGLENGFAMRMHMAYSDIQKLLAGLTDFEIADGTQALWNCRKIKSQTEIELLRKASQINEKAIRKAYEEVVRGQTTEFDLYCNIAAETFKNGCEKILQLGIRNGPGRYDFYNCPPSENVVIGRQDGEICMVDGGPSYQGYYSDIIRQACTGKMNAHQQKLFDTAVGALYEGLKHVAPGKKIVDAAKAIDDYYDRSGLSQYLRGRGGYGHGIGLDVHEYPMMTTAENSVFEAGMVMAIEPELCDPEAGVFGIEQNFVVTENGYEILSDGPDGMYFIP